MHEHFRIRVRQRIGEHVDPAALYQRIIRSITSDDGWCRFKCRQANHRKVFRFELDGRDHFVVVNMVHLQPITILPADAEVRVGKKGKTKRLSATTWRRWLR